MTAMETCKMAELRYEAPLATFDMDEWNEFLEGEGEDPDDDPGLDARSPASGESDEGGGVVVGVGGGLRRNAEEGNFEDDETFTGSLEDLVNTFDDKIIKCFRNYGEQAEIIAPVQVRTQDDLLQESQTWWTLTGNYGGILPIDWSQLYPQNQTDIQKDAEGNTESKSYGSDGQSEEDEDEEDDDDEDDETDMDQDEDERTSGQSSYSLTQKEEGEAEEEPVVTADEVIKEIDGILDGLQPDKNSETSKIDRETQRKKLEQVIKRFTEKTDLKSFSVRGLSELRDELTSSVRDLSEILVEELAIRDELDYEKELKNQFIWLLLTVQKRRREVLLEMSYRQKTKVIGNGYLTTVIPYQESQDPLAIEKLQIYIKILSAINEDHCSVPSLLTDYILRVLCPTT